MRFFKGEGDIAVPGCGVLHLMCPNSCTKTILYFKQAKKKSNKQQAQKDPKKTMKQQTKAKSKGGKGKR